MNSSMTPTYPTLTLSSRQVPAVFFHDPAKEYGFLSNWYLSPFDLDGMHFTSLEQYIMYRKCMLFREGDLARMVLATNDPGTQQLIGRSIPSYLHKVWDGARQMVLYRGLMAKFGQNEKLRKMLLDTGDAFLVEAARSDAVWSCHLSVDDPNRLDASKWSGSNLLGFALMEVREALRRAEKEKAGPGDEVRRPGPEGKTPDTRDRIRGCIFSGAVGDALGYPVEFLTMREILGRYGDAGIKAYEKDPKSGKALISDDTQMSLFTAEGLSVGDSRGEARGIQGNPRLYVMKAYKDWLKTQDSTFEEQQKLRWDPENGWHTRLLEIPELYSWRAPGNTCLSALRDGTEYPDYVAAHRNNSKGCGGIMRVAPLAANYSNLSMEELDMEGAQLAAITHGHSLGYMPAAVLVHILNRIIFPPAGKQKSLREIVIEARLMAAKLFEGDPHLETLLSKIDRAIALSMLPSASDIQDIPSLGEGWVAEETLAIAIYCALRYEHDFSAGVTAAVNHSGDSDSTGAVTGNILGAINGYEAIEPKWKEDLELSDLILKTADQLHPEA